jgi:cell division protein FtsQ
VSVVLRAERAFGDRRRARRHQAIRRRFVRPVVVIAVVVTAAGGGVWAAWSSPLLAVQTVTIKGTSRLTPAEVRAAAGVPIGRSLLRLDPGSIQARVARLPAVRTVTVDRDWPHRLVITVTERRPVAVVSAGGRTELLDAAGVAFATVDAAPRGLLPIVLGAPVPGPGDADAHAALAVWSELPASLRTTVIGIDAASPADVALRLRGRRTVVWGDPTQAARKLAVLRALMAQRASTYDVSTPDVPVTKP